MATLQETLRKNKQKQGTVRTPGGQLSSETTEGIQTLAGQVGIAPPTTPLGAAGIGATPDQQKMMGSPAQKTAALDISGKMAQGQNLQTAVRTGAVRTQATGEEQATEEKSEDMKNLGSLGQRVSGFIDAQRKKLEEAAAAPVAVETADKIQNAKGQEITGDDLVKVKDLLAQFRQNPTDPNIILQVNQALGYDINTQWNPADVEKAYESSVSAISKGGAANVDDALTVADLLTQPEFGYDANSLSQLLGVPADQLQGMSVGQLRSEIERVGQEEFSKSQQLQEQAQSVVLGEAERGLARQAGREASATGLRASEADVQKIEQSIQNADKIMFAGKEMQVDELLKDETISNTIKDYMESSPDSDFRKMIEKTEPQLKQFIDQHKAILEEATKQMEAGAGEFRSVQEANKALTKMGSVDLDPVIAEKLIPGYNTLQAKRVDPQSVPILAYASGLSDAQKTEMGNALNKESKKDSTIPDQLSKLTKDEIAGLGIGKAGSNWEKASKANDEYKRIAAIPPGETATLLQTLYTDYGDDMPKRLNDARSLNAMGVDPGIDTTLLSSDNLKQAILSGIAPTSLKSAAAGNISQLTRRTLGRPAIPTGGIALNIYNKLGPMAADGSIDANDINSDAGKTLKLDDMMWLEDQANAGRGKIDKSAVTAARLQRTYDNTNREIASNRGNLTNLLALVKQDPRIILPSAVAGEVFAMLQNQIANGQPNVIGWMEQAKQSGNPDVLASVAQLEATDAYKTIQNKSAPDRRSEGQKQQDAVASRISSLRAQGYSQDVAEKMAKLSAQTGATGGSGNAGAGMGYGGGQGGHSGGRGTGGTGGIA